MIEGRNGEVCSGITDEELTWIRSTTRDMNAMMGQVPSAPELQGVRVSLADPQSAFAGRGACMGTSNESIHEVVLDLTPGDAAPPAPSGQSFHPTLDGVNLYAQTLNDAMRQPG